MYDLKKPLTALLAASLVSVGLAGCTNAGGKSDGATDSASIKVTSCGLEHTFATAPKRVVSMGVTGLAFLTAAGAEDSIIARANEWGEQPASWIAEKVKTTGKVTENISMEALVSIQPDLAYGGGFEADGVSPDAIRAKEIPAIVDSPECHYFYPDQPENESFNTILGEVTTLGKLMGTSEKAAASVTYLKSKMEAINKANPGAGRKVSFAYYFGEDTDLFSYGSRGVMGEIQKTLGLHTAIDPNYHPHQGPIAPEAFVKSDPDMIIVLVGMGGATKESSLERLAKIPGYKDMRAVKNNQIFFAESAIAYASPTALYGTIELANQIVKSNG